MKRNNTRKTLVGTVISTATTKTIIVAVDSYRKHPLYGKRFKRTKKFAAHDEIQDAKVGDKVKIISTRPLSKTKKFRLESIHERAREGRK